MKSIPGAAATRRFGEGEPVADHDLADPFQRGEGRVTLIEVCHLGLTPEGCDGTDAADTEHELLLYTGLLVAAVEPCCDAAIRSPIGLEVRVEKIEPVSSDKHRPHLGNHVASRQGNLDPERTSHGVVGQLEGKTLEVKDFPRLLLQPAVVQPLMRCLPVEEADADQRNAERARGLEKLAGYGAKATCVDR